MSGVRGPGQAIDGSRSQPRSPWMPARSPMPLTLISNSVTALFDVRSRPAPTASSLDPVLFEHRLRFYELVDFGVFESVLVHDLTGVLSADGRRSPNAARRVREVDRLPEVFET